VALPAHAQITRNLPASGQIGTLTADPSLPLPFVRIDNRVFRLAPGAVIVDTGNLSIVHAQIPPRATVLVDFDAAGDALRIFMLTPEELARLRRR
jgi:hypothetical protein